MRVWNTAGVVPRDAIHIPAKTHCFRGALLVLVLGLLLSSCGGGPSAILQSSPGDAATGGVPPAVREAAFAGGEVMSAPSPPRNLVAEGGDGMVTLTWQEPADNGGLPILGYNIYRGETSGGEQFLISVLLVTTYIDLLVNNGKTYFYQVTAFNPDESGRSNEAVATPGPPPPPPTAPGPPEGLSAIAGNAVVDLSWSRPGDPGGSPIKNYNLYRSESSGGETFYKEVGNVLSYSDTDVSNGVTYYYMVSAENDAGEGALSDEASATPVGIPGAPANLQATAGDGRVTLAWSAPESNGGSEIQQYRIYRRTPPDGEALLASVGGHVLSYTDTMVSNGVTYYFRATAVNGAGEGPFSDQVSATPMAAPRAPAPPLNLRATAGDATVTLEWSPPADLGGSPIKNYNLYRSESSGGETFYKAVGNVLSYSDTDVSNGVTYYYKASAENDAGEGALSDEAFATPEPADTVPDAPRSLSAVSGDGRITLAWQAPNWDGGTRITNYTIHRRTPPGGESLIATVGDVRSFTDMGRENGVTYYYQVRAVNNVGAGPPSNEASATPATVPGAPQELKAMAGDARVTIQWSGPEFDGGAPVTNYRIYRGTTSGSNTLLTTVESVTSYSDEALTNDVTYYYRVSAVNRVDEGPPSGEVSAMPTSGPTVPNAPRSLVATAGNGSVTLAWLAPVADGGSPVLNYTVYRGLAADHLAAIAEGVTAHSLWNGGLTNGKPYYYAIAAVNAVGVGPRTAPVSATPSPTETDTTKPTIRITSPTSGATVSHGTITVYGTASDDVGVARIEVSADGTTWMDASGTDAWTATLNLAQGDRTIYARATDVTSNFAIATVSVSVTGPEGSGGTEPTPTGGGDPRPALILMAFLSFALAGGIAWFILGRRRKP